MSDSNRLHCGLLGIEVRADQSLTRCIIENQCFSDDPCPLQTHFNARRVKGLLFAAGSELADQGRSCAKSPGAAGSEGLKQT